MRMKDGMPAGWGPSGPIPIGRVELSPHFARPAAGTPAVPPRVARFALDNCNAGQRRFIHTLGALLTEDAGSFRAVLEGRSVITAREDGTAYLRTV